MVMVLVVMVMVVMVMALIVVTLVVIFQIVDHVFEDGVVLSYDLHLVFLLQC